jgi:hypothetical protein
VLGDEVCGLFEVNRKVVGFVVDPGDVHVVGHYCSIVGEFVAASRGEHCLDVVSCMAFGVLLRVFGFCAASTLLMKMEPRSREFERCTHSISSGKRRTKVAGQLWRGRECAVWALLIGSLNKFILLESETDCFK